MRSAEYRRGYDAGYKQALLHALERERPEIVQLGGPDAPYKQTEEWKRRMRPDPILSSR